MICNSIGKGLEMNFRANLYGIISAGPGGYIIFEELFFIPFIKFITYNIESIIYLGDAKIHFNLLLYSLIS